MHLYDEPKDYLCPSCQKWWKVNVPMVSCAVLHYGTGCCHYGDTEVDPPEDDYWEFRGRW